MAEIEKGLEKTKNPLANAIQVVLEAEHRFKQNHPTFSKDTSVAVITTCLAVPYMIALGAEIQQTAAIFGTHNLVETLNTLNNVLASLEGQDKFQALAPPVLSATFGLMASAANLNWLKNLIHREQKHT